MGLFNGQHSKANGSSTTTVIAANCRVDGKFDIDGGLHVDGNLSGHIECSGTVTIGQSGQVDGEINSNKLLISGLFSGICRAENIQILAGGKLEGTLYTSHLVIEPGGNFLGDSHDFSDKKAGLELVHNSEQSKSAEQS
jgi:cytoskeletal protein CcmA (bactofilin family)